MRVNYLSRTALLLCLPLAAMASLCTGCGRKAPATAGPSATSKAATAAVAKVAAPEANYVPTMSTHPGTLPYEAATDRAIAAALKAQPADYRPRTRHHGGRVHASAGKHVEPRAPAGAKPNYTNRLILSSSPYLRQHAHNPVDWRPWGEAAFAEARKLGRPIFLSVGYSTCHWCHVMEHESFEDLEIARVMNTRYVPIKLDREERPDVDAVYMAAVHAMGMGGGWPMSVWIAPGKGGAGKAVHGVPFFAGTYFPPRQSRGRRRGFLGLMNDLADRFAEDPEGIAAKGNRIASQLRRKLETDWTGIVADTTSVDRLVAQVRSVYDNQHGGTRRAPKFPSNIPYGVLMRHHLRTGDRESRRMAVHSLERMRMGGIYDHVGGGFARYSTDVRWLVPHFEKMLYDQGLITKALVEAWTVSSKPSMARTIRQTLDYLLREMRHPGGAFYSATDADSEGEEGRFFLWTPAQLQALLSKEDAALVAEIYDVTPGGNFEHRNILHLREDLDVWAQRKKVAAPALRKRLRSALDRLYTERAKRVPPLRDDKILTAWNGLIISAFARAGLSLAEPRYVQAAGKAADYVLATLRDDQGRLLRTALGGKASGMAVLDDHAFFIEALIDLFEATGEQRWLAQALRLQANQDRWYSAPNAAGYFTTATDAQSLLAREKPDYDGAIPSGNSVSAMNLVRLAAITGESTHRNRAVATIRAFSRRLRNYPIAMSRMLVAVEALAWPMKEVVLVRPAGSKPEAFAPMLAALRRTWQPHHVLVMVEQGSSLERLASLAPPVRGKIARDGRVTAYVCKEGACRLPTTQPAKMIEQLLARGG